MTTPSTSRTSKTAPGAPKSMGDLRARFGLKDNSDAEALLQAWPIKEAFHYYLNRCLSNQHNVAGELPEWQEVDQYLLDMRMMSRAKRRDRSLKELVEEECFSAPYQLMPHVALFVLRAEGFLQSDEGTRFDIASQMYDTEQDKEFDRRWRSMDLLCFLVGRHCPNPT
ncbi:hypothetical protein DL766_009925 [Monosporascus sp. MC13-8B]|uniref:Uncharacterized protein n=1 Tax=Monosporascus cannonballus TaxID=155416 RepID=A0ABY0H3V9_9PEZI|nr:hypothetical protein DL762_007304 [Monosporascus cannonballus]RYO94533.1 hypothetical protein DL763_004040 [Monosporascus cannonballus]RYP12760.1 hypothetical protein DL766_009925 [Monosporascus sp. MC13-8B]